MDEMPNPTTPVEMREHLEDEHGVKMEPEAGWWEMDSTHRHHHRVSADHGHAKVAMV